MMNMDQERETETISGIETLVVEDSAIQATILKRTLVQKGYAVTLAKDGAEGLAIMRERKPMLIISDINMPVMNGYQMCHEIKHDEMLRDIPIILLTSLSDPEDIIRGLECGADNFITKPYDDQYLLTRIEYLLANFQLRKIEKMQLGIEIYFAGKNRLITSDRHQILDLLISTYENAVQQNRELIKTQLELKTLNEQLEEKVKQRTKELCDTQLEAIRRLGIASELHDDATGLHIIRMSRFCAQLGRAAGMNEAECELLLNASLMHDVGKIGIPDRILLKPGKLEANEWEIMKTHAVIGAKILSGSQSEVMKMAETIALTHHEKWDGSGYPNGLKGEDIPLVGRICGLCDAFDALISDRPYKKAWSVEEAMAEIESQSGKNFDPHLVELLKQILPEIVEIKEHYSNQQKRDNPIKD